MVSVTPESRDITSASRYHPCYESRSSMYVRCLISRNFAELAEAVPIDSMGTTANNKEKQQNHRLGTGRCQKVNEYDQEMPQS